MSITETPEFIKRGWLCPRCNKVLSPDISFCPFCCSSADSVHGSATQPILNPILDNITFVPCGDNNNNTGILSLNKDRFDIKNIRDRIPTPEQAKEYDETDSVCSSCGTISVNDNDNLFDGD